MGNNYWRLNPSLSQKIDLDQAEDKDIELMKSEASKYIRQDDTQLELKRLVKSLVTPEDYEAKALKYLFKAANLIEYNKSLERKSDDAKAKRTATILKLLSTHYAEKLNEVTETDTQKEQ